jgi:hypothetical protein
LLLVPSGQVVLDQIIFAEAGVDGGVTVKVGIRQVWPVEVGPHEVSAGS